MGMNTDPSAQADLKHYGDLHTDAHGVTFARREIGDLFVQYTYLDDEGQPHSSRPFPRVQIISDAVIAEMDARWAIEEGRTEVSWSLIIHSLNWISQ